MTEPIKLIPKPTLADESKASLIETIEAMLVAAKNGEIDATLIVERDQNQEWQVRWNMGFTVLEAIGALEALKWDALKRIDPELGDDD